MVKIAKAFVTNADDSPAYWQIGNLWQVMATGVQTDNAFTLLDQIVHTGGGGGRCTFNAGGHQGLPGTPGTFVSIPGNTEHSFTVDEPDTHVLNFYLPAGFEQLLIGISHPAQARRPPPAEEVEGMMAPPWLAEKLSEDYGQTSILGNPFVDRPDQAKMLTKPTPGATLFPFTSNARDDSTFSAMAGGCWTILAQRHANRRLLLDRDEMFYVLAGRMTIHLGDRVTTAMKGSLAYIPSGTVYSVRVDSDEAHCLNLHTKSGFEELIELAGTHSGKEFTAPAADFRDKTVDASARARLLGKIGLLELDLKTAL